MQLLGHVCAIISYLLLLFYWWRRASAGVWAPSTFFGFYTIVFGMPVYFFSMQDGMYVVKLYEEDPTMAAFLLAFGAYPAAFLAMYIEKCTSSNKNKFSHQGTPEIQSADSTLKILFATVIILSVWIFATPRLGMITALVRGLSLGDSSELNYMRRVEFSDGFFNQKVFTWCRFAIGPVLALLVNEALRGKLPSIIRWAVSFVVYFLFSAAFHKSTWMLGFGFIAINEFFAIPNSISKKSKLLAASLLILSSTAGLLMAIAYVVQYRSNEDLSWEYHLAHGFTRLFGCINDGLLTFTYVFPNQIDYMPGPVLLGFLNSESTEGPARLSALALGVDTTIQPGVLGHLYAGLGMFCIPVYIIFIVVICQIANKALLQSSHPLFKRVAGPTIIISIMWVLHNPLFPSIFSSGLFLIIFGCYFYGIISNPEIKNGGARIRSDLNPSN